MGYAAGLPVDKNNSSMQEFPAPKLALGRYGTENSSASSVITLTDNTTTIEVGAVTTPAVLRWVATTDTQGSVVSIAGGTANFDHIIPTGGMRRFVVPQEGVGVGSQSVMGVNRQLGLYRRVAIKSTGVGSVLTAEFGG